MSPDLDMRELATGLALALIGFALALPAVRPAWSGNGARTAAIPLGVIAAGTIYNYSFPGLAWLLGAALMTLAFISSGSGHDEEAHRHREASTDEDQI